MNNGGSGIRGTLSDMFPAKMESRYSAHDKSSMCCDDVYVKKAKSFRNSCSDSYDCSDVDGAEDSVNDAKDNLIRKLLIENKILKKEVKSLRASHDASRNQEACGYYNQNEGYTCSGPADGCLSERNPNEKLKKNVEVCQFCGLIHRWGRKRCSAYGHRCCICWKENHLEKVCFYRQRTLKTKRQIVLSDKIAADLKAVNVKVNEEVINDSELETDNDANKNADENTYAEYV